MVQQLLRGSSELNRMRAEIKTFFYTIFGLIEPQEALKMTKYFATLNITLAETNANGIASVKYEPFSPKGLEVSIYFDGKSDNPALICNYSKFNLSLENIQRVYAVLPAFLKSMLTLVPSLNQKIQPLLEAGQQ